MTNPRLRRELIAAGVTPAQLRNGSRHRPWRGVYLPAGRDAVLDRIDAALRLLPPRAVVSHETAAYLHDLPLPLGVDPGRPVHVTLRGGYARQRRGLQIHQQVLGRGDGCRMLGRPATSEIRTFLDLAGRLSRRDVLALADGMLRLGYPDRETLQRAVWSDAAAGRRGICAARELVELADRGAQSPFESYLRLILLDAGLRPECQVAIRNGRAFVGVVDLGFRAERVAIEYDGRVHDTSGIPDLRRQNALNHAGWIVLRYVAADVLHHPERIVTQVRATLNARGQQIADTATLAPIAGGHS